MKIAISFDPPLCLPGHASAEIEAIGDILDGNQPDVLQVEVLDGTQKRLALGLFRHVGDGLYRLEDGSCCTGDGASGVRIEKR